MCKYLFVLYIQKLTQLFMLSLRSTFTLSLSHFLTFSPSHFALSNHYQIYNTILVLHSCMNIIVLHSFTPSLLHSYTASINHCTQCIVQIRPIRQGTNQHRRMGRRRRIRPTRIFRLLRHEVASRGRNQTRSLLHACHPWLRCTTIPHPPRIRSRR